MFKRKYVQKGKERFLQDTENAIYKEMINSLAPLKFIISVQQGSKNKSKNKLQSGKGYWQHL